MEMCLRQRKYGAHLGPPLRCTGWQINYILQSRNVLSEKYGGLKIIINKNKYRINYFYSDFLLDI